jgi:two-component system, cell cycle response regulator
LQLVLPAALGFVLGWATARTRLATELAGLLRRAMAFWTSRRHDEAGVVIDVVEAAGQADSASFVDQATGLANRRYLDMFLQREVGRAQRFGKPVSVAVFNVDGAVTLSQEVVDQALIQIGERSSAGIRDYDVVGRYAPARLVAVLPEAPFDEAMEVTERLRASLSSLSVGGTQISVSVGLATFPEHGATADELINAAHYFLNRGKLENPDKVHSHQQLAKAS